MAIRQRRYFIDMEGVENVKKNLKRGECMKLRSSFSTLFVMSILALVFGTAFAQQAIAQAMPLPNNTYEERTYQLVNTERMKHGLKPFIWHDRLASMARSRSWDDALGSTGTTVSAMLQNGIPTATGHHAFSYSGNNTPEQMVAALMNSSSSRDAILQSNYTYIGAGVLPVPPSQGGTSGRHNWTLIVISLVDVAPASAQTWEMRVLELTNNERKKHGLQPLTWHNGLAEAARAHSADMMRSNMTGHIGSDGSNVRKRIERAGVTTAMLWAENCAYGQTTPEAAVEAWMNSPGHRANILNGTATHLGVGLILRPDGSTAKYASYWTQVFAAFR